MNSPKADSVNSYSTNSNSRATYESTKERYEDVDEDEEEEQEEDDEEEITPAELIEKLEQVNILFLKVFFSFNFEFVYSSAGLTKSLHLS